MKFTQRYVIAGVFCSLTLLTILVTTHFYRATLLAFYEVQHPHSRSSIQLFDKHFTEYQLVKGRRLTAEEYRENPNIKTGNSLIDDYGKNNPFGVGEDGREVIFPTAEAARVKAVINKYQVNVIASDITSLNRLVPDSRLPGCARLTYEHDLPTTTIIIPFYNEWPSILLRTVYSIINRTPRHLLQEILLIDDGSDMVYLKKKLNIYVDTHFPERLVRILRMPTRVGLIRARQEGWRQSTGDVIVIFDSHMEVNVDWLQPLLTEIKKNRKTVALGTLDYIKAESLKYTWHVGYQTRYGFDWRLIFFETFFRPDLYGTSEETPKIGAGMVGAAYAIDRKYFGELGGYDEGMKVWGGENLEMAWRVWMCGGNLIHLPCSKIGHIARAQPYKFPGGRRKIEVYNYKRAIDVWMEPQYKKFVYDYFPEMELTDVGDISSRLALKEKLHCKNFTWYLEKVWPELLVYDTNVFAWGSARNPSTMLCLDNHQYLFQAAEPLFLEPCHFKLATQGFSWTHEGYLRTSLQCVVLKDLREGSRPQLEDCIIGSKDKWLHIKNGILKHVQSNLCLDIGDSGPVMKLCLQGILTQQWNFNTYNI